MNEKVNPNPVADSVSAAAENSIWPSEVLSREADLSDRDEPPRKKITLIRAFKERSRLIRQINQIHGRIETENSVIEGGLRSIDVRQSFAEYTRLYCKLISLKKAISRANCGIIEKLVELAEIKTLLHQINEISTNEGKQVSSYGDSELKVMTAELKTAEIAAESDALQARMDALQDEIDEFNVRTLIEFEP